MDTAMSASAKMEALGEIIQQLLIALEKAQVLGGAEVDSVMTTASATIESDLAIASGTRRRAQEYVEAEWNSLRAERAAREIPSVG